MSDRPTFSPPFADMAARIDHNRPEDFAGAFVIVPPSGAPIEVLSLDKSQDLAAFWSMVRVRIEQAWKMLEQQQAQGRQGWPR